MTQSESQVRQSLVAAAADLLSRRGFTATSIRELAKYANAPVGSIYHYFPGGKLQVTAEALQFAGNRIEEGLAKALKAGPLVGLRHFLGVWRDIMRKSNFLAGCPVLSVATAEFAPGENTYILDIAAKIFAGWETLLRKSLTDQGLLDSQAQKLATLIVAATEGSVAVCRAKRSIQPLETITEQLETMIENALSQIKE